MVVRDHRSGWQFRAGQDRTGQDRAGQGRAGQEGEKGNMVR